MKKERKDTEKVKILEEMEAKCMKEVNIQRSEGKEEISQFSPHI
jgi:hypothetical protein